ncbi:hypothetical protein ABPG72_005395 [Tetrahymena utriculariae]
MSYFTSYNLIKNANKQFIRKNKVFIINQLENAILMASNQQLNRNFNKLQNIHQSTQRNNSKFQLTTLIKKKKIFSYLQIKQNLIQNISSIIKLFNFPNIKMYL